VFTTEGFEVIQGMVPPDVLVFAHKYLQLRAEVCSNLEREHGELFPVWGVNDDGHIKGAWSCYADPGMEVLLKTVLPKVEKRTGGTIVPTFSYVRVYRKGNVLKKHIDRVSCEISCSLNIGGDPWPIYIKDSQGASNKFVLAPGDGLVYKGHLLEHWREPLKGDTCTQVFLFYKDVSSTESRKYDGRDSLGMPRDD
jgi:hypothetical protein